MREPSADTLEFEPRCFGDIADFAHICVRNGDHRPAIVAMAMIAMNVALQINPRLHALKAALQGVHADGKGPIH